MSQDIKRDHRQWPDQIEIDLRQKLAALDRQERNQIVIMAMIVFGVPISINLVGLLICRIIPWLIG